MRFLRRRRVRSERGQVLIMFAGSLTVLLGFSALVTDLGLLWAVQQKDRAIADAAALAGAQEMQAFGTRSINTASRGEARYAALANVRAQVGGLSMPNCVVGGAPTDTDATPDTKLEYPSNVRNCPIPGTNYVVSVLTPSPLCVNCELNRSIMVEIQHNSIPTFFAGLFGQTGWSVRQSAVAGIGWDADFAIMVLRPPSTGYIASGNGTDGNQDDLNITGNGTRLKVSVGDIGTNTNMLNDGIVTLDEGYYVHHLDHYKAWTEPPTGRRLGAMIPDPNYPYPTRTGAPIFATAAAGRMTDAQCNLARAGMSTRYTFKNGPVVTHGNLSEIQCMKPGVYTAQLRAEQHSMLLFTPGVYFLDGGLFVRSVAIGGFIGNAPGVTLVFREGTGAGLFDGNNAESLAMNAGERFLNPDTNAPEASAALGWDGQPVVTAEEDPLKLTIMVAKDPNCVPQRPYPGNCDDNANKTLSMSGGGKLYLAGVQYAPTDHVSIGGGAAGLGHAGRIVAWTIKYHGGVNIEQAYPGVSAGNGVIRLDAACSGAGATGATHSSCNP